MSDQGYRSTSAGIRLKLELLLNLPDNAEEWLPFMRTEMRLPVWMLPALQAAVRQQTWRSVSDPVPQIRSAVRRLALEMRLSNPENA